MKTQALVNFTIKDQIKSSEYSILIEDNKTNVELLDYNQFMNIIKEKYNTINKTIIINNISFLKEKPSQRRVSIRTSSLNTTTLILPNPLNLDGLTESEYLDIKKNYNEVTIMSVVKIYPD